MAYNMCKLYNTLLVKISSQLLTEKKQLKKC